jgi:hypothetical protein
VTSLDVPCKTSRIAGYASMELHLSAVCSLGASLAVIPTKQHAYSIPPVTHFASCNPSLSTCLRDVTVLRRATVPLCKTQPRVIVSPAKSRRMTLLRLTSGHQHGRVRQVGLTGCIRSCACHMSICQSKGERAGASAAIASFAWSFRIGIQLFLLPMPIAIPSLTPPPQSFAS